MADISKIKTPDGTTHDIVDYGARELISSLNDTLENFKCSTVPNGLTSPSLPTGIFAFSGTLADAPGGYPGIIINTHTSSYQRQLVISGGSDQKVHMYARVRYKNSTDPWPSWTTLH